MGARRYLRPESIILCITFMCIIGKGGTEIGFGASVYDSSIVMSEFLQEPVLVGGDSHVAGKSVVELGCGPGLNSIAATLARAAFVYCTDGDDASVELAHENFTENIRSEGTYK